MSGSMPPIKFQQQICDQSCTSACLAMVMDVPIDLVVKEFHQEWIDGKDDPSNYLSRKGIAHITNTNPFKRNIFGGVHLLTVPSLNVVGGIHHILIDLRYGQEIVLDPQKGRSGKLFYTGWTEPDKHGVELHSWVLDMTFEPEEDEA